MRLIQSNIFEHSTALTNSYYQSDSSQVYLPEETVINKNDASQKGPNEKDRLLWLCNCSASLLHTWKKTIGCPDSHKSGSKQVAI